MHTAQKLRRTALTSMIVLAFMLGILVSTKSFAQDTTQKPHKYYLNLGLSCKPPSSASLFQIDEFSINATSHLNFGLVAEFGLNARLFQGSGGHFLLGYDLLNKDGWHIFPFLQVSINQRGVPYSFNDVPAVTGQIGIGIDYEIPNTRLMLGLRMGTQVARVDESSSVPNLIAPFQKDGFQTSPTMQLRIGWRIGE